ncbi:hypothetical protein DERP_006166 [Dermatophagoides pteronyssinus]|uniref:Uncharacterized protein n=1 Tax=Dermatophagoides pteronyssinus TaxID=6956 RepID=A0ABQ8IY94_DERPT|nr:hypothetical protein DERP_006166 [Dermatophagoides pteronyssinus]
MKININKRSDDDDDIPPDWEHHPTTKLIKPLNLASFPYSLVAITNTVIIINNHMATDSI